MLHTPLEKQLNLQEEFLILFIVIIIVVVIVDDDNNGNNNNIVVFPFYGVATATVLIENSGTC